MLRLAEITGDNHAETETLLSVAEAARQLGLSATSTRKITKGRDGCRRFLLPGSKKPIIRITQRLVDELLRQSGPFRKQ